MSSSGTPNEIPTGKEPPVKNANESSAEKSLFQETPFRSTTQVQTPSPPSLQPHDGASSYATLQHLAFPTTTGGQDGSAELIKALMAHIQLDRQETKERECSDKARIVALENALLKANAQQGDNVIPRRGERTYEIDRIATHSS
ncbi:putative ATP binding protein [Corchorus olitorius]|uniref:ATP binding protein n=1 Tax=Corchorus olitorius TaxID=93759 RepID=A0A1R3KMV8_9ROSI|nr:putative ATP binding protein [Corchorus olitorius]